MHSAFAQATRTLLNQLTLQIGWPETDTQRMFHEALFPSTDDDTLALPARELKGELSF